MSMSLLEMVREARGRMGQPVPGSAIGNTDPTVIQCVGIFQEFLEDLVNRKMWQSVTREATFTTVASESQGGLSTLFPYGFEGILPETFYNRTTILPIVGSKSPAEWAFRKAAAFSGPLPVYRIRNNEMLFNPVPTAGQTIYCEYYSSYFVYNSASTTYKKYWSADTDTCLIDDGIAMQYFKWAWKSAKGLSYAEDFRKYEMMVAGRGLRDAARPPIRMDGSQPNMGPGVVVSPGSWPLP